jgi:hypothetical protein
MGPFNQSLFFPANYETSRQRFRGYLERIRVRLPGAQLVTRPLAAEAGLSLDWIEAGPLQKKEKVLLFTQGEHGVEAFVGSAMLALFMEEFLPGLDPASTGLVLVHAINPWGMQHLRRVNAANVDLNRNFVWDEKSLDPTTNPDYARVNRFLNPPRPAAGALGMQLAFAGGLLREILRLGVARFRSATLLGQYRFSGGIYYGGETLQEETRSVMDLFRQAVTGYERILLLDMHTGYGPRYRMSVVNSAFEPRDSHELSAAFGYPNVVKSNPSEFYAIQGDMIDYIYTLAGRIAPEKHLYATTFEFGTFGDSFGAVLRSLRAMVFENQAYWYGVKNEQLKTRLAREMMEMFNPQEANWQTRALENGRAAFKGILRAEGFTAPK